MDIVKEPCKKHIPLSLILQNQMTSNQMRRIEEERVQLKEELDLTEKRKEELQSGLNEASKELCKLEAKVSMGFQC